jgi:hypothetical protein
MQRLIWLGVRSITGKNYKDVDWTSTAKEDDKLKVNFFLCMQNVRARNLVSDVSIKCLETIDKKI